MRAAPPIELMLPSGRREQAASALLFALAGGTAAYWLQALHWLWALPAAPWVLPALAALLAACVGRRLWRPLQGRLRWDGAGWSVAPAVQAATAQVLPLGRLDLMLDLGGWMLLRGRPAAGGCARWAGVRSGEVGPVWHGLRVALFADAGSHRDVAAT